MHTTEEKAIRRARVEAVKEALRKSATLDGHHVRPARAALKSYLRRLDEPRQPTDQMFQELIDAPFREIPDRTRRWDSR